MRAEVVVVGGGLAGIHAAREAAAAGARVLLLDEGRPGQLRIAAVTVWRQTLVWGIFPERDLAVYRQGRATRVQSRALVLAPGAHDRPVAFPGSTLPGVVTAAGATALTDARRVLCAGAGPAPLAAGFAFLRDGADVVGIAQTGGRAGVGAEPALLAELRRAGVPIWPHEGIVRVEGAHGVERAVVARLDAAWRPLAGTARTLDVDTVCLGYGLVPATELAEQAGCALSYRASLGGWVPLTAPARLMATSAPGVFVAGDAAGAAGAWAVAEAQGRLAGLGAARFVCRIDGRTAAARARAPLRQLGRLAAARRALGRVLAPRPGLADWITADTLVCRCEAIPASRLRAAIAEGARHVSEVRALTRCGMGLCQGRQCISTVALLIARETGRSPGAAGRLTARPPVRPVPVGALVDEAREPG